ncbi:MAG: shikimate dehydrogenase family protein [Chitinophagales bacterium]
MNHDIMRIFGLIGYPLSHTFSPTYFNEKFFREGIEGCNYHAFPLQNIADFENLIKNTPNLQGLNVTIPYKEAVLPLLDEISEEAREVGAVNTIRIDKDGKKTGFNTDVYGFENSLRPLLKPHHQKALILGTGGASKAIVYVLQKLGISPQLVSRNPSENQLKYDDIDEQTMNTHHLIINTTPLGMSPKIHDFPDLPYQFANEKHLFFDLVYNPEKTIFLIKGKLKGADFKNGLEMLYLQAERAWEIWNK